MWSDVEQGAVAAIVHDLKEYRKLDPSPPDPVCTFSVTQATQLMEHLASRPGCIVARHALEKLNADLTLPFRWKLDHKLIQVLVMHQLFPALVPPAIGLARAMTTAGSTPIGDFLAKQFPRGYVIKPTRGSGGRRATVIASADDLASLSTNANVTSEFDGRPQTEAFLVQEKIETLTEYRVHTIGSVIVPTLIMRNWGSMELTGMERHLLEEKMQDIVSTLPDGLKTNLLYGWDIGLDRDHNFHLFEVNVSGMHPVFRKGFQCSGRLGDAEIGPLNTARLLRFLSEFVNVRYEFEFTPPTSLDERNLAELMYRIRGWLTILDVAHRADELHRETYGVSPILGTSLRKLAWENKATGYDKYYLENVSMLYRITEELRRS